MSVEQCRVQAVRHDGQRSHHTVPVLMDFDTVQRCLNCQFVPWSRTGVRLVALERELVEIRHMEISGVYC